jgi:hypothetical protein
MATAATWKFGADTSDFKRSVGQMPRDLNRAGSAIASETSKIDRAFSGIGSQIKTAALGFVSLAAAMRVGRDIFSTVVEVEKLRASLETVAGGADQAKQAFEQIQNFATTTPFELSKVTEAFITLKTRGLDASAESMDAYGNIAAAFSKSIEEVALAVGQATVGEMEMLKQLGITARQSGNEVTMTFNGVSKTIGKNSREITEYLKEIGQTEFAGAMERQMERLPGKISNLQDSISNLYIAVGDSGVTDMAAIGVGKLTEALNLLGEATKLAGAKAGDSKEQAQAAYNLLEKLGGILPIGPLGQFASGFGQLNSALKIAKGLLGEAAEGTDEAGAAAEQAAKRVAEGKAALEDLSKSIGVWKSKFDQNFLDPAEQIKILQKEIAALQDELLEYPERADGIYDKIKKTLEEVWKLEKGITDEKEKQAEKDAKAAEKQAESLEKLREETALIDARLRGDTAAEENILQKKDMREALKATDNFEAASNFASAKSAEREAQRQSGGPRTALEFLQGQTDTHSQAAAGRAGSRMDRMMQRASELSEAGMHRSAARAAERAARTGERMARTELAKQRMEKEFGTRNMGEAFSKYLEKEGGRLDAPIKSQKEFEELMKGKGKTVEEMKAEEQQGGGAAKQTPEQQQVAKIDKIIELMEKRLPIRVLAA